MSAHRAPLPTCAAAALALALAACGGSSTKPSTDDGGGDTMTPPMTMPITLPPGADAGPDRPFTLDPGESRPHGDVIYTCPPTGGMDCEVAVKDGRATTAGGTATAHLNAEALYRVADRTETDAKTARMAADAALKEVEEARMGLGVLKVQGDSRKARMRAQAVLDESGKVTDAVDKAKEALDAAREAKADAVAHHGDDADLLEAIDEAIEEAEAQVRAAEAVRADARLKAATDAVTGGPNADPQRTAAAYAEEEVARRLYASMELAYGVVGELGTEDRGWYGAKVKIFYADPSGPRTSHTRPDGSGIRVVGVKEYSGLTPGEVVKFDNAEGKTFEELVDAELVDTRVGTATPNVSKAARGLRLPVGDTVLGLKTGLATSAIQGLASTGNGYQTPGDDDVLYMGIPGRALCTGICTVAGSGTARRTFSGAWIFIPKESETRWVPRDGGGYEKEEAYVRYGYWLSTETDGDVWVNLYTASDATYTPAATVTGSGLSGQKATYAGEAVGMAARRVVEGDGFRHHSGAFEADARLTVTFGSGASLEGVIDDFRAPEGGNPEAVNTDWSLKLTRGSYFTAGAGPLPGLFIGTAPAPPGETQKGRWQIFAWGKADEVPPVLGGDFSGGFADGRVEGAFGVRKTEE